MDNYIELNRLGTQAKRKQALERAESYRWFIEPLVKQGLSYEAIRRTLIERRIMTPSGNGSWSSKEMVRRIVTRLELRQAA